MLDTNVLLDVVTADDIWLEWSQEQFREAAARGLVMMNPIIYAELAPAFESERALDGWVSRQVFRRLALPYEAAFRAATAFTAYRERGGTRRSPLPDFYIGAHAELEGFELVTRDAARYRTYFPELELIGPEE